MPAPRTATSASQSAPSAALQRFRPQVTATSSALRFTDDDRPHLDQMNLPGPRREREGRGGAQSFLEILRYLIRCPLLPAMADAIAPSRGGGRPSAYPHIFWVFYAAATREAASAEVLGQELRQHWNEIAKEFYFEHDVALPTKPGVAYSSYNSWRTNNVLDRDHQLDVLLDRLTSVSAPLALSVRSAEGWQDTRDLLDPTVWDIIAADGTIINAPSDVRPELTFDSNGHAGITYPGSRAHPDHPERARVHETQRKVSKRSGSPEGLYNVAVTTKGRANYTRTVLAVDLGRTHDAENPVALGALRRTYDQLGHAFPVLVYDGAITPVNAHQLTAEYGAFTVNSNHARNRQKSNGAGESQREVFPTDSPFTGEGVHKFGHKRGKHKRTYVTSLPDIVCAQGHTHHVNADDGAVYEIDRPATSGGHARRLGLLPPTAVERLRDDQGVYSLRLTLSGTGSCGDSLTMEIVISSDPDAQNLSWRDPAANIRVIPDVVEQYAKTMGHRNQVESFFFWLERRYYRHDRAASWGRDAQLFDLISAALLHNAETWAHLARRHPHAADELERTLTSLETPDLSNVKRKPLEERKKAIQQQQQAETIAHLLAAANAAADTGNTA